MEKYGDGIGGWGPVGHKNTNRIIFTLSLKKFQLKPPNIDAWTVHKFVLYKHPTSNIIKIEMLTNKYFVRNSEFDEVTKKSSDNNPDSL